MRGRQTAVMLRMMELEALVVADVETYVTTAIKVAGNQSLNRDLRAIIHANKRTLFDRYDLNSQFADALIAVAAMADG